MKYFSLIIIFFLLLGCSESGQTPIDVEDINVPKKFTAADIVKIIKNGSYKYNYYAMGSMPPNMAEGKDVEEIAEYIINDMKGERPVSFSTCTSCHGLDGKGMGKEGLTMSPNLFGPNLNKKACVDGNSNECISIGDAFKGGSVYVEKNITKTIAFYNKACCAKNYEGCFKLADIYSTAYDFTDYDKAHDLYEDICDAGYYKGCTELGYTYEVGRGVKKNTSKAMEAYKKACDGGNEKGCVYLGSVYKHLKDDRPKAIKLFEKACDNNYYEGCLELARIPGYGSATEKEIKLLKKVCRVNDKYTEKDTFERKETRAKACVALANIYEGGYAAGNCVERNMTLSNKFHIKGCEGDNAIDHFCMVRYLDKNRGTRPAKSVYPSSNRSECESLKSKFLDCVQKSYLGLSCKPGTDIILPPRCR